MFQKLLSLDKVLNKDFTSASTSDFLFLPCNGGEGRFRDYSLWRSREQNRYYLLGLPGVAQGTALSMKSLGVLTVYYQLPGLLHT